MTFAAPDESTRNVSRPSVSQPAEFSWCSSLGKSREETPGWLHHQVSSLTSPLTGSSCSAVLSATTALA